MNDLLLKISKFKNQKEEYLDSIRKFKFIKTLKLIYHQVFMMNSTL